MLTFKLKQSKCPNFKIFFLDLATSVRIELPPIGPIQLTEMYVENLPCAVYNRPPPPRYEEIPLDDSTPEIPRRQSKVKFLSAPPAYTPN